MSWKNLLTSTICFTSCSLLNAATYPVTDGSSLQSAIANSNITTPPTNTITFSNTINLATTGTPLSTPLLFPLNSDNTLSPLSSNSLTISGGGNILNGNGTFRGFFVRGGTVAINNLTFSQTAAVGGSGGIGGNGTSNSVGGAGGGGGGFGGALYVCNGATVTLTNATFSNSTATGGAGGALLSTSGGGGGGGGLTGAGGVGPGNTGGGGGGGFAYSGGSASGEGAGGGGGCGQPGANSPSTTGGNGGGDFALMGGGTGGAINMNGTSGASGAGGGGSGAVITGSEDGLGGDGLIGGGGGGGGLNQVNNAAPNSGPNGGIGGNYAGGGGGGSCSPISGTASGGIGGSSSFGGGGGGGGRATATGSPAIGGDGGQPGFGGGGGGGGGTTTGSTMTPGTGGRDTFTTHLGGIGANGSSTSGGSGGAGGGGAALGGAIFIENGGVVNFAGSVTFGTGGSGNSVTGGSAGGAGAGAGTALGQDIFMQNGALVNFSLSSPLVLSNPIQSENQLSSVGGGVNIGGTSSVDFATHSLQNTYMGTTTISSILIINSDENLGFGGSAASNPLVMNATAGNPTLEIAGAVILAPARDLSFTGSGTSTFLINAGDSLTYAGALALGTGNLTVDMVNAMSACNLSGAISGGGLTISGLGTLTLSGTAANTYSGTTTLTTGTLQLNKTPGMFAIPGNVTVNGGTLQLLANDQIAHSSNMILGGGIFTMGGFTATLNSLTFNSGTLTPGGGTLILGSASTALTMQTGTTISQPGTIELSSSGSVVLSGASGTASIASSINLGGGTVNFNMGGSTVPVMQVTGVISNGAINVTGSGTLLFQGLAPNTYGLTTVTSGTLQLGNTPGSFAIPGNVTINGGTLQLNANDQIAHTSNMLLAGGNFDMQTFPATINSLVFNTGATVNPAAQLTLESTGSAPAALTMQGGTTLMGPIVLAGANPFVVFDPTNNGTATISDTVTLGTGTNTWNIPHGTASFDMVVSGAITGPGSFVKTGNGVLNLAGTNTYVGTTTVSAGKLAINGSITSNVTVDVGATLQGTGTVIGNVDVFGFMSPGNSVGTFNVNGTYTQETGSTLNNEITPTVSDLVSATGNIIIDAGATFALIPDPGIYTAGKSYPVMQSTGGTVSGTFSNFTNTNPMVMGHLVYTPTEVFFQIDQTGLVLMLIPPPGNAGKVAAALDKIVAAGNTSLDPLIMTLVPLRGSQLVSALNQLQPSLYKGMAVVQENNVVKVHDAVGYRFQNILDENECYIRPENDLLYVWVNGLGDFSNQKNTHFASSPQVGYGSTTAGAVGGIDFNFRDNFYMGALGAYTHSNVSYKSHQGHGAINSSYAGLYASAIGDIFYGNAAVIRSWNHYDAHRNIVYPGMNETARNKHSGNQVLTHFDTGLNFNAWDLTIRPFDSFDYITQQEQSFKERGGGLTNLSVLGKTFRMIRNELGLNFAKCFSVDRDTVLVDAKFSWVREVRLKGKSSTSQFVGTGVHFTTVGYFVSRSLFSPGLSVTYVTFDDLVHVMAYYNGEFGSKYRDQSVGLEVGFQF